MLLRRHRYVTPDYHFYGTRSMTKKRKNLVVSDSFNRKLEILTEISGAPPEAEAFRRAIDLYVRLMKKQLAGAQIEVVDVSSGQKNIEDPLYDLYNVRRASSETIAQLGLSQEMIERSGTHLTLA